MEKHSFTEQEDTLITDKIKQYPTNLQSVFKLVAAQLGLDKKQVENRWYKHLRHCGFCFMIVGANNLSYINTKNIRQT